LAGPGGAPQNAAVTTSTEGATAGAKPAVVAYRCPQCGWSGEFDSRFPTWCESCGYRADPTAPEPTSRWKARAEANRRARAEALYERLRGAENLRPTSAAGVAVTVISTVVHLVTLSLPVLAVLLVVESHEALWAWVVAVLAVLIMIAVRPRVRAMLRKPKAKDGWIGAQDAPHFFDLLEQCAAALKAPVPDRVRFDARFNAATTRFGLKQRAYVLIGIPFWQILTGPQRITLLGHELGHQVNGDTTHGLWAGTARESLFEWMKVLDPRETGFERQSRRRTAYRRSRRSMGGGAAGLAEVFAPILMILLLGPFFLVVYGCHRLLTRLDLSSGHQAEYLADELGARLGSTQAAVGMRDRAALAESVRHFLANANRMADGRPLWPALRDYLDSIPDHEKRRRVKAEELRGTRVDATHPANYLRRRLLLDRPEHKALIEVSDEEWAAIDAELKRWYDGIAAAIIRDARG
jgi:Zn-dependent protease with chaperone function